VAVIGGVRWARTTRGVYNDCLRPSRGRFDANPSVGARQSCSSYGHERPSRLPRYLLAQVKTRKPDLSRAHRHALKRWLWRRGGGRDGW
jgi:hypothetical protein